MVPGSEDRWITGTYGTLYSNSNFGGAAIRCSEVPGAMGVLESLDNPLLIGIALRIGWAGAEGLALFRLQVPKVDLPSRRMCQN